MSVTTGSSNAEVVVLASIPWNAPPPLNKAEVYAFRAVERETFFGRESLSAFDQQIVDSWYDLLWFR